MTYCSRVSLQAPAPAPTDAVRSSAPGDGPCCVAGGGCEATAAVPLGDVQAEPCGSCSDQAAPQSLCLSPVWVPLCYPWRARMNVAENQISILMWRKGFC